MKRFSSIAALAALLLTSAACGDDSSSTKDTASTNPDTVQAVTSEPPADVPVAIVSLSPTATEMVFAIGAGDQVIAVDDYSNFPAEALDKPHDLSGYEPSVEAIAALKPDLVLLSDSGVQAQLEALGIAVWVGSAAATFDDVYAQIEQLGAATGHVGEAAELVGRMQTGITAIVASVPKSDKKFTYFHELDNTLYTATSATFIGAVYGAFGLENIADAADPDATGYPQLSAEYVIQANPDLIFLADGSFGESAETVAARPGWGSISAVVADGVFVVDDGIASRWGPRVVDYLQLVADALIAVSAKV